MKTRVVIKIIFLSIRPKFLIFDLDIGEHMQDLKKRWPTVRNSFYSYLSLKIEYNLRDLEREMLQAVVTMLPPSSPTSKSPFFNMQAVGGAAGVGVTPGSDPAGGATNSTAAPAVAEVYNNVDLASAFMGKSYSKL